VCTIVLGLIPELHRIYTVGGKCRPPSSESSAVGGQWGQTAQTKSIQDPWTGEEFITLPDPQISEILPYVESLKKVTKSGLHNPYKNPERYTTSPHTPFPPESDLALIICVL